MSIVFLDSLRLGRWQVKSGCRWLCQFPILCSAGSSDMSCSFAAQMQCKSKFPPSAEGLILSLSCIKDEILVVMLVLILVPFEMLVGHLQVSSVFKVERERGTECLSLVLVVHVRRLSVTCEVFACHFPRLGCGFFCVFVALLLPLFVLDQAKVFFFCFL